MTNPGPGYPTRPGYVPEEFLGQIRTGPDAPWEDYARGTEESARRWQRGNPTNRRVVHWIYKEQVLIAPDERTLDLSRPGWPRLADDADRAADADHAATREDDCDTCGLAVTGDGRHGLTVIPGDPEYPSAVPATGGTEAAGHVEAVASCPACIANGLTGCASTKP